MPCYVQHAQFSLFFSNRSKTLIHLMQLLHWPTISAVPVVLLVCAVVWYHCTGSSVCLTSQWPLLSIRINLPQLISPTTVSYLSQLEIYFTSNTIIIFMNGEHQLDKQEPVMVVGADNMQSDTGGARRMDSRTRGECNAVHCACCHYLHQWQGRIYLH